MRSYENREIWKEEFPIDKKIMKIRNVLGALLFLVSGFISCEDNSLSEKERNRLPVQFTSGIDGEIQSRVTGTKWDSGDAIGIFMKRNGQLLSAATILDFHQFDLTDCRINI